MFITARQSTRAEKREGKRGDWATARNGYPTSPERKQGLVYAPLNTPPGELAAKTMDAVPYGFA